MLHESRVAQLFSRAKIRRVEVRPAPYPDRLNIETKALQKIREICQLVRKHHGTREWYAFLIARADNLAAITDVLLEENDDNTGAHTAIAPAAIAAASARAAELGCRIVGWVHSHATMSVFFSRTDRENIALVLSSVSLETRVLSAREELADEIRLLAPGETPAQEIGLCMEIAGSTSEQKPRLMTPVYTGWSYNVVVNDRDDLYAEVAIIEENPWTRRATLQCKIIEPEPIESTESFDVEALSEEVRVKIRPNRWGWSSLWNGRWRDDRDEVAAPKPKHDEEAKADRAAFLKNAVRTMFAKLRAADFATREIRDEVDRYHEHQA